MPFQQDLHRAKEHNPRLKGRVHQLGSQSGPLHDFGKNRPKYLKAQESLLTGPLHAQKCDSFPVDLYYFWCYEIVGVRRKK